MCAKPAGREPGWSWRGRLFVRNTDDQQKWAGSGDVVGTGESSARPEVGAGVGHGQWESRGVDKGERGAHQEVGEGRDRRRVQGCSPARPDATVERSLEQAWGATRAGTGR